MRPVNFLVLSLLISFIVHVFCASVLTPDVITKGAPAIYGWPNIVNKADLLSSDKQTDVDQELFFSFDDLRREYFSLPLSVSGDQLGELAVNQNAFIVSDRRLTDIPLERENEAYVYLWERPLSFSSKEEESVSYNTFVSRQGKVLFIYPDKLPVNSSGSLEFQEYIRKASFFFNDNFFWTKVEGVVK